MFPRITSEIPSRTQPGIFLRMLPALVHTQTAQERKPPVMAGVRIHPSEWQSIYLTFPTSQQHPQLTSRNQCSGNFPTEKSNSSCNRFGASASETQKTQHPDVSGHVRQSVQSHRNPISSALCSMCEKRRRRKILTYITPLRYVP